MNTLTRLHGGLLIALAGLLGGCAGDEKIARGTPPLYSDVSRRVTLEMEPAERIFARATVEIRYVDQEGERRFEQGEGRLRIQLPALVALSAGKVGETLFWLGCDDERYWWFDLTGRARTAVVGEHNGPGRAKGGLATTVNPRDLPRLMGVTPVAGPGATQWSDDGKLLGISSRFEGGFERRWVDPVTLQASKIEIFDIARKPVLIADLSEYEAIRITGSGEPGPRVPTRIAIGHPESGTEIRLYLSDVEDGANRPDAGAFDFNRLYAALKAERLIDLDQPADQPPKQGY